MTDLARNAPLRFRLTKKVQRDKWVLDNSAAQTIYVGAPMMLDMNVDTVYARVYDSNVTAAADDVFLGIASEAITVATTDTETDNEIEIITRGEVGFQSAVFTDADVGKTVYFSDSGTLTATAGSNLAIGTLARVVDGYAYININPDGPYVQS